MKLFFLIVITIVPVCFSCHEIYNPDTDNVSSALVVSGRITDQPGPYTIQLSLAVPYDGANVRPAVQKAKVSITDDGGNTYKFTETSNGNYVSNPAELIGQPGKTYTLHIETTDGNNYESEPQTLQPNDFTTNVYAQSSSQDNLVEDAYGGITKVTIPGVDLLVDIQNNSDTLPRFRFIPVVTVEYAYSIIISPMLTYTYFCWNTSFFNDINITSEKYQSSSTGIKKHAIYFQPANDYFDVVYTDPVTKKDSILQAPIINYLIKLERYRISNRTYQFYKDINTLLSAEGKLFDPIASQVKGNIKCKTDSRKLVLGFFDASSIRTSYYAIRPGQLNVRTLQRFNVTPSDGCTGGVSSGEVITAFPPDFWVY